MNRRLAVALGFLLLFAGGCGNRAEGEIPYHWTYQVVNTYPHDPEAFTQGLEWLDGFLYESTGQNGKSTIRKVMLESGAVVSQVAIPEKYFGEGLTIVNNRLIGLTWTTNVGFVYSLEGFQLLSTFHYPGQGWGLTHNGDKIYMSDGSSQLRVWDPITYAEQSRFNVHDGDKAVDMLNELEWVKGEVFANIWQTDRIARISPSDGRVTGWIDLDGILPASERARADVLNGIAYDEAKDRLFITGKLWPKLFEIKLVKK